MLGWYRNHAQILHKFKEDEKKAGMSEAVKEFWNKKFMQGILRRRYYNYRKLLSAAKKKTWVFRVHSLDFKKFKLKKKKNT
jgi:hypothetical protein